MQVRNKKHRNSVSEFGSSHQKEDCSNKASKKLLAENAINVISKKNGITLPPKAYTTQENEVSKNCTFQPKINYTKVSLYNEVILIF